METENGGWGVKTPNRSKNPQTQSPGQPPLRHGGPALARSRGQAHPLREVEGSSRPFLGEQKSQVICDVQ